VSINELFKVTVFDDDDDSTGWNSPSDIAPLLHISDALAEAINEEVRTNATAEAIVLVDSRGACDTLSAKLTARGFANEVTSATLCDIRECSASPWGAYAINSFTALIALGTK
jgi:hypothetical protein